MQAVEQEFVDKWAPRLQASAAWVDCGTYGYTQIEDLRPISEPSTDIRFGPKRAPLHADEKMMRELYSDVESLLITAGQGVEAAHKLMQHATACFAYDTPHRRVVDALNKALAARYYGEDSGIQSVGSTGGSWWDEK